MNDDTILQIEKLCTWYGGSQILRNINLQIRKGETVTLAGRNGSGRTTLMKAILRMVPRQQGTITFRGVSVKQMHTPRIARQGIAYCPEGREIFATLSCEENLTIVPQTALDAPHLTLDEIYQIFPNLYKRRKSKGGSLSGGEQQMLALARVMLPGAHLYLLDEISEGLAPIIVNKLYDVLVVLKEKGATILLAEQNFAFARELSDTIAFIEQGEIFEVLPADSVTGRPDLIKRFLTL